MKNTISIILLCSRIVIVICRIKVLLKKSHFILPANFCKSFREPLFIGFQQPFFSFGTFCIIFAIVILWQTITTTDFYGLF